MSGPMLVSLLLLVFVLHLDIGHGQGSTCPNFCECNNFEGSRQVATCIFSSVSADQTFSGVNSGLTFWLQVLCLETSTPSQFAPSVFMHLGNLQRLDIIGCQLGSVTEQTFSGLLPSSLTNLTISSSKGLSLSDGWLRSIPSLNHLDLSNNELDFIPAGSLCGSLTTVNLSANAFESFESLGITCDEDDSGCTVCQPNLRVLDISENDIEGITAALVGIMPRLRHFNAYSNFIGTLDGNTFQGMANLELVDLTWNELEESLPAGIFQNLGSLTTVKLRGNDVNNIDTDVFEGSPMVKHLDLAANGLSGAQPRQFTFLHNILNLEYLDLSANLFQSIPTDLLLNKQKLKTLRVLYSNIKIIPDGLFVNTPNLDSLNMGGNKLNEITENMLQGLTNLKTLILAANTLTTIHVNAFIHTPNLEMLFMYNNMLPQMPVALKALDKLNTLYTNNNKFPQIDTAILADMDSLNTIFLDGNQLTNVPISAFGSDSKVETLDMSYNRIASIHEDAFSGMSFLKRLWLNANRLTRIDINFVGSTPILSEIDFSFNSIERVEYLSFPSQLKLLNLSNNVINFISEDAFTYQEQLEVVDLSKNKISLFSPAMINTNSNPPPKFILLQNPDHTCTCTSLESGTSQVCSQGYIFSGGQQRSFSEFIQKKDTVCNYKTYCDLNVCMCCHMDFCVCRFTCPPGCTCARNHDRSTHLISCTNPGLGYIRGDLPETSTSLKLRDGQFVSVEANALQRYSDLRQLDLGSCGISELTRNAFIDLGKLEELLLGGNSIKTILTGTFEGLGLLKKLNLQENALTTIESDSFNVLVSLEELHLNDNNLLSIDLALLSVGKPNIRVHLQNNNWICDCDFGARFKRWVVKSANKVADDELLCGNTVTNETLGRPGENIRVVDFSSCPASEEEEGQKSGIESAWTDSKMYIIIGVAVPVVLIVIAIAIFFLVRSRRSAPENGSSKKSGIFEKHMGRTWKRSVRGLNEYAKSAMHENRIAEENV